MKYTVEYKDGSDKIVTKQFDSYEQAYKLTDSKPGARMYSNGQCIHKH